MWGIRRLFTRQKVAPWTGNFISSQKIKTWLGLSDFQMEQQKVIVYRPPLKQDNLFKKLNFMEKIGSLLCPVLGGVYIMVDRAKVLPLTPIRMQWKQRLSSFRISPTITGTIARRSE